MIEKIIHYCWFGNNDKNELVIKCIASWRNMCPDYQIIEWNENNFDINCNEYIKKASKYKKWAFISDYARLWIIYNYGGIYLDTDVELLKPLDDLLDLKAFMGIEKTKDLNVATGLGFGSEKYNIIIKEMMEDYENISFLDSSGKMDLTPCPERNTKILYKYGFKNIDVFQNLEYIKILPTDFLCPIEYNTGKKIITNNTFSIHHYSSSWLSKKTRFKIIIAKHLGPKKTESFKKLLIVLRGKK